VTRARALNLNTKEEVFRYQIIKVAKAGKNSSPKLTVADVGNWNSAHHKLVG
jgi:hypothetical protein